jgi:hypothetical protein
LIFVRVLDWRWLFGRSAASKNVELLVVRHKGAVLRPGNPQPWLDWADRAVLTALIRLLPRNLRVHRLVTPGTVLRWHRCLMARKWTYPPRAGRPPVSAQTATLIERLTAQNRSWGHQRIQGELLTLGHRVSASTIRRFLTTLPIPPAPQRQTDCTWRQVLRTPASTMLACDFFHVPQVSGVAEYRAPTGSVSRSSGQSQPIGTRRLARFRSGYLRHESVAFRAWGRGVLDDEEGDCCELRRQVQGQGSAAAWPYEAEHWRGHW